eukprot:403363351
MVESKTLKYLDPDLYVKAAGEGDIEQHYICLFCYGVVLDPTECRECQSLYCKGCIGKSSQICPNRCTQNEFQQVNRIVRNALVNKEFKCQNQSWCTEVIKYENYIKHFEECKDVAAVNGCECQGAKFKEQILSLEQKLDNLQFQSLLQDQKYKIQQEQLEQCFIKMKNYDKKFQILEFKMRKNNSNNNVKKENENSEERKNSTQSKKRNESSLESKDSKAFIGRPDQHRRGGNGARGRGDQIVKNDNRLNPGEGDGNLGRSGHGGFEAHKDEHWDRGVHTGNDARRGDQRRRGDHRGRGDPRGRGEQIQAEESKRGGRGDQRDRIFKDSNEPVNGGFNRNMLKRGGFNEKDRQRQRGGFKEQPKYEDRDDKESLSCYSRRF